MSGIFDDSIKGCVEDAVNVRRLKPCAACSGSGNILAGCAADCECLGAAFFDCPVCTGVGYLEQS